MRNKNIFIVSSTINTNIGYYDSNKRFQETAETIRSIRSYASDSIILLIDNSTLRLDESLEAIISSMVDYYIYIGDRKICIEFNKSGVRSAGEAYILLVALDFIQNNIKDNINRIFKLSGRYLLTKDFNIEEYNNEQYKGRYCFRKNDSNNDEFFHTRLWSFCFTQFNDVKILIQKSLNTIFKRHINIEEAFFVHIDKNNLVLKDRVYCEGKPALWNNVHIVE